MLTCVISCLQVTVWQGNSLGGCVMLFSLEPGHELLDMFYNSSAEQLVCVSKQNVMTVHVQDDTGWNVMSKMRFSTGISSRGQVSTLTTTWAGEFSTSHMQVLCDSYLSPVRALLLLLCFQLQAVNINKSVGWRVLYELYVSLTITPEN